MGESLLFPDLNDGVPLADGEPDDANIDHAAGVDVGGGE